MILQFWTKYHSSTNLYDFNQEFQASFTFFDTYLEDGETGEKISRKLQEARGAGAPAEKFELERKLRFTHFLEIFEQKKSVFWGQKQCFLGKIAL